MERNRTRLVVLFTLAWSTLPVHTQSLEWLSHYGNGTGSSGYNIGMLMTMDPAGSLYCAGGVGGSAFDMDGHTVPVAGDQDVVLAKLDPTGHAEWAVRAGGGCSPYGWDYPYWVGFDHLADRVLVAGSYGGDASFGNLTASGACDSANLFLASYDTDGVCHWVKHARTPGAYFVDVLIDPSSQLFWFMNPISGFADFDDGPSLSYGGAILARYGSDGEFHGAQHVMALGQILAAEWAGADWLLGGDHWPMNDSLWNTPLAATDGISGFLAQADTSGNVQWVAELNSPDSRVDQIERLPSRKIITRGRYVAEIHFGDDTLSNPVGCGAGFVAAYAPNGESLWGVPFVIGQGQGLPLFDMQIGPDGSIYVQGRRTMFPLTIGNTVIDMDASSEMFVAKLDTLGNLVGVMLFGRVPYSNSHGSILLHDDALFVSCSYDSTMVVDGTTSNLSGVNAHDLFVAKFHEPSSFVGVQRSDPPNEALRIRSNPNNGLCTIDLPESLQRRDGLVLSVFDNTGQLVQRAAPQFTDNGLKLDVRSQARGVYHVELSDGTRRYTGRLVYE